MLQWFGLDVQSRGNLLLYILVLLLLLLLLLLKLKADSVWANNNDICIRAITSIRTELMLLELEIKRPNLERLMRLKEHQDPSDCANDQASVAFPTFEAAFGDTTNPVSYRFIMCPVMTPMVV